MTRRANAVLHVVTLSHGNEVDHLRDLPRSACSDAALDRVRAVLAADGVDTETGLSIRVTDVGPGWAVLAVQAAGNADPIRAWVCWAPDTADRYWTDTAEPGDGRDRIPMRWLSENVLVPWLAIRAGAGNGSAPVSVADDEMHRLLAATAWVLIEEALPTALAAE